ncbi:MAG: hypothetical protein RIR68_2672 [Pseudomonadota bacterium]
MKRILVIAAAALALVAQAQNFPGSKPISIVVPFAAGGPTDKVARDLAVAMAKTLPGGNFVVENVAGAGGTIGASKIARANPDGHSLLLFHIGMAATPALYRKLSYKPLEDFEFLGMVNDVPMTLIGKPQLPANTYRDFENYIRANAGKLNIAHAGLGSASHICGCFSHLRHVVASPIAVQRSHDHHSFWRYSTRYECVGGRSSRCDVRSNHQHHSAN